MKSSKFKNLTKTTLMVSAMAIGANMVANDLTPGSWLAEAHGGEDHAKTEKPMKDAKKKMHSKSEGKCGAGKCGKDMMKKKKHDHKKHAKKKGKDASCGKSTCGA